MNNETEKSSTKYMYKLIAFDPGNVLGYGVFIVENAQLIVLHRKLYFLTLNNSTSK